MTPPTRTDLVAQLHSSIQEITTRSGWCGYYDGDPKKRAQYDKLTEVATERLWALLRQLLDCAFPQEQPGGSS